MNKKDFFNLVQKYNEGKCSKKELAFLYQFCEDTQFGDITETWNLSKEEKIKTHVFRNINSGILEHQKNKKTKILKIQTWSAAALVISICTVGYLYIQNSLFQGNPTALNTAITLELEDGTVKILSENSSFDIKNNEGKIVGTQKVNQLIYDKKYTQEKLKYNTLTIPNGKTFNVLLSDGTKVTLNAGSTLKYPTQFLNSGNRNVYVTGEAYLKVAKDSKRPFIVNVNNLNIRVLGTEFNVSSYPENKNTEVVLVEGSVCLYPKNQSYQSATKTILKPGFKASYHQENQSITTNKVITNLYTAWMNGEIVCRDMTFLEILTKLERHYNVVIENSNKELATKKFNASFRSEPIENVLKKLKNNYGMDYQIEKDKIIIK